MIDVNSTSTDRFHIGDRVEWTSKRSGNHYYGQVVRIRENRHGPEYLIPGEFTYRNPNPRGGLVTVKIAEGTFRNFYEKEVKAHVMA